ncbi:hypothetical protein [Clostridium sp. CMCC3677]|uniref:hypothetical protein n=1 Tax=Clostridium sp. CMCC3677 TaxID=2949963 RepID=UPI0013F0E7CF|nr:hypothetical protein [Clostridium sp. CMCC3677]NFG61999.1 hypothetical protein [Clostridium botulinum]NFQ08333.1 hypothetical protein [Clostridium botulinum]
MLSNSNEKKSTPWWLVILLLIIFWPVGIYFLYKKLTEDKTLALRNSKILRGIGWVFICFAFIYLSMILGGNAKREDGSIATGIYFAMIFFAGGSIFMIHTAKKMKLNAEKCKKYISIVANENETSINNIATSFSTNSEQVFNDLNEMINKGFFGGAHIDLNTGKIVLPQTAMQQTNREIHNNSEDMKPKIRAVKCKNCGANNKVVSDKVCECEFCGSILE